ncbi:hypothetical protein PICMEDRAFT_160624 [Pichia membranifaciens NRRL Y-2026]|uniref:PA14 domain-containing protein n=1 Tax=Pichia membranifaciens NRRL Y-2026 TaxID=763406 RepID=A0A1E3NI65_9ASCO|nr:hypothetical protein PICMEDRAFT_160624 [Pichia membranifaciens NRRL Y-2026]ODQ45033.1 hypothetical protein PICMEDRAFT_160624 [Pichia membranifaciens NRRL Y-2026]
MFSNVFLAATLLLSLVNTTIADRNVWSKSVDGVGALMQLNTDVPKTTGFAATFYSYPWGDFIPFWKDSWVQESYSFNTIRATANAVTSPNFSLNGGNQNLYGLYNINMENVVIELKGYYSPTASGVHRVTANEINDGGFIWIGQGAFDACSQESDSNSYDDVLLGVRSDHAHSSYIYLEAGLLYPIRVVYFNVQAHAQLQFQIVDPNGNIIDNFQNVYNFPLSAIEGCKSTTRTDDASVSTVTVIAASDTVMYSPTTDAAGSTYYVKEVVVASPTATVSQALTSSTTYTHSHAVLTGNSSATGCNFDLARVSTTPGFHATFFKYECCNVNNSKYYANSYTEQSVIGTAHGISSPNYSIHGGIHTDTIYNDVKINSGLGYVNQLTGYFYAQESGLYAFTIKNVNDGAMVWFGNSYAFSCCQPDEIPYNSDIGALIFTTGDDVTAYVHFDAGQYYPMRIVLVNILLDSQLDIMVVTPSVILHDNWSDWVYSISDVESGACPYSSSSSSSSSSATSSNTSGASSGASSGTPSNTLEHIWCFIWYSI